MEYAMGLLKTTRDGEAGNNDRKAEGAESLTDFIRSYEDLLSHMSNKLIHFSAVSLELVQGQKKAQQNAREVDGLLGEMEAITSRISLLALNTSVVSGGVAANERSFVEMSDKIRELSQSTAEFNRRIRSHMQGMKTDLRAADESMANMAHELKDVARTAQADVVQVTTSMRNKNKEVTTILENINALGEEVKQDIYKIIMSLQFQDITQQRLEHLKNPLLSELRRHLSSITDETRVLNKKLQAPTAKSDLSGKAFRIVGAELKDKAEPPMESAVQTVHAAAPERPQRIVGTDIELF